MNQNFSGTGVAIITPFDAKGNVDTAGLKRLVDHLIHGKVEYLVVLGTTGETATLTGDEKKLVIDTVKESAAGRIPLVLGIGGNNTAEVVNSFKNQDLSGFSGILSVSPYYNKPSQEGIFQHYMAVGEASPLPVILYNVPGRTAGNMTADTTLRIATENKKFVAIKEASGNMEQVMRIIKNKPEGFEVISGDDNLTLPILAAGGKGVISVVANAYPRIFSDMVRAAIAGNLDVARPLHYSLYDFTDSLFADGNPGGIKAALKEMGICGDTLRLPLVNVNPSVEQRIISLIAKLGK